MFYMENVNEKNTLFKNFLKVESPYLLLLFLKSLNKEILTHLYIFLLINILKNFHNFYT